MIYGGYETPVTSCYEGNINLYTRLSCSPCWLKTPCPYEKKCLAMIHPEMVIEAVWKLWGSLAKEVDSKVSRSD